MINATPQGPNGSDPRPVERVWKEALSEISLQLTKAAFQQWFQDAALVAADGDRWTIGVRNAETVDWLAHRYHAMMESNVRAVIHAYNGGPGNYRRWRAQYPVNQVLFTDLVPNEENETFAKKVIKYYKVYDWLLSDGTLAAD